MSQYTPEQVERLAFRTDWMRDSELKRGEAAAMLRAYAATLKAAQGGVTEAINWSEFWNRISQNFDSADVDKVRACYKAALSAQQGRGEAVAEVGDVARYINTGSPRWDSAAFKAWKEGNQPGSHNWMKRIRELLAASPAPSPAERVPEDDVRDAARYRFIRDVQATIIYKRKGHGVWEPLIDTRETSTRCASLDEAVDRAMLAASPAPSPARGDGGDARSHRWDEDGERCVVCGDKDWMGGPCNGPRTATTQDTRP